MSIRGIDTSLMINRAPPLAQEASNQQRHLVNFQNYLTDHERHTASEQANRVLTAEDTQFNRVGQQHKRRQQQQQKNEDEAEQQKRQRASVENLASYDDDSLIDIRI